jgi:deazaflavin-dependent oxidoreductase (nitroreductase family)
MNRIPPFVRFIDPLARRLLKWGIPMGPNTLLTVPGRKSGQPRTAAVAVVEVDGRRWVIGSYGNVNWVRNLRAAGEGMIGVGGRQQRVSAVELSTAEVAAFFRDVLVPYTDGLPLVARMWVPREIIDHPENAASSRPVFELHAQPAA